VDDDIKTQLTEPMADTMDNDVKRQLTEYFPVSLFELDRLLDFHVFYQKHRNGSFSLSEWLASSSFSHLEDELAILQQVEEPVLPPDLVSRLLEKALATVVVLGPDDVLKDERTFFEAMCTILGRRGQKSVVELIESAAQEETCLWLHRLAVASHLLNEEFFPETLDLTIPKTWTSESNFLKSWKMWDAPGSALSTFMHLAIFSRYHPFRPPSPMLMLPELDKPSSLWRNAWDPLPLSLALMSPSLGGTWRRLYSNDCDGFSFRTMLEAVLAFKGPTVILIRSTDDGSPGDVFGYSTSCPWKTSRKWFGEGSDSFLFKVSPNLAFYPATGNGKHYMYLNLPSIRHAKDLSGMAMGGIAGDCPRLHLTESLEKCRACDTDVTYAPGPLLSNDMEAYFDVDVLEVWATNETQDSFERGVKSGSLQTECREATRQAVAKVDPKEFLDDFTNGTFINKAFGHRDVITDRHSYSIRDVKEHFSRQDSDQRKPTHPEDNNS
jgi:hypothetical protein